VNVPPRRRCSKARGSVACASRGTVGRSPERSLARPVTPNDCPVSTTPGVQRAVARPVGFFCRSRVGVVLSLTERGRKTRRARDSVVIRWPRQYVHRLSNRASDHRCRHRPRLMGTCDHRSAAVPSPVALFLRNAVTTQARAAEQSHPFGQTLAGSLWAPTENDAGTLPGQRRAAGDGRSRSNALVCPSKERLPGWSVRR